MHSVMKLVLDSSRSQIRVRTYAEGFFSKLAHDLELACRDITGSVERTVADEGKAAIEVPVGSIEIGGVLKGGRVDPDGLSAFERSECLSKMRKDVFHSGSGAVVRAMVVAKAGKARVTIVMPNGREHAQDVSFRQEDDGPSVIRATGSFPLSLQAIGSVPVKGPMNAFRVKDGIDLFFDVTFTAA